MKEHRVGVGVVMLKVNELLKVKGSELEAETKINI
jgi:hypothetical protein